MFLSCFPIVWNIKFLRFESTLLREPKTNQACIWLDREQLSDQGGQFMFLESNFLIYKTEEFNPMNVMPPSSWRIKFCGL